MTAIPKKKDGRGGRRPGAGRPRSNSITVPVSIPLALVGRMDLWRSRSGPIAIPRPTAIRMLIEQALNAEQASKQEAAE